MPPKGTSLGAGAAAAGNKASSSPAGNVAGGAKQGSAGPSSVGSKAQANQGGVAAGTGSGSVGNRNTGGAAPSAGSVRNQATGAGPTAPGNRNTGGAAAPSAGSVRNQTTGAGPTAPSGGKAASVSPAAREAPGLGTAGITSGSRAILNSTALTPVNQRGLPGMSPQDMEQIRQGLFKALGAKQPALNPTFSDRLFRALLVANDKGVLAKQYAQYGDQPFGFDIDTLGRTRDQAAQNYTNKLQHAYTDPLTGKSYRPTKVVDPKKYQAALNSPHTYGFAADTPPGSPLNAFLRDPKNLKTFGMETLGGNVDIPHVQLAGVKALAKAGQLASMGGVIDQTRPTMVASTSSIPKPTPKPTVSHPVTIASVDETSIPTPRQKPQLAANDYVARALQQMADAATTTAPARVMPNLVDNPPYSPGMLPPSGVAPDTRNIPANFSAASVNRPVIGPTIAQPNTAAKQDSLRALTEAVNQLGKGDSLLNSGIDPRARSRSPAPAAEAPTGPVSSTGQGDAVMSILHDLFAPDRVGLPGRGRGVATPQEVNTAAKSDRPIPAGSIVEPGHVSVAAREPSVPDGSFSGNQVSEGAYGKQRLASVAPGTSFTRFAGNRVPSAALGEIATTNEAAKQDRSPVVSASTADPVLGILRDIFAPDKPRSIKPVATSVPVSAREPDIPKAKVSISAREPAMPSASRVSVAAREPDSQLAQEHIKSAVLHEIAKAVEVAMVGEWPNIAEKATKPDEQVVMHPQTDLPVPDFSTIDSYAQDRRGLRPAKPLSSVEPTVSSPDMKSKAPKPKLSMEAQRAIITQAGLNRLYPTQPTGPVVKNNQGVAANDDEKGKQTPIQHKVEQGIQKVVESIKSLLGTGILQGHADLQRFGHGGDSRGAGASGSSQGDHGNVIRPPAQVANRISTTAPTRTLPAEFSNLTPEQLAAELTPFQIQQLMQVLGIAA